jgi:hypothetical protein
MLQNFIRGNKPNYKVFRSHLQFEFLEDSASLVGRGTTTLDSVGASSKMCVSASNGSARRWLSWERVILPVNSPHQVKCIKALYQATTQHYFLNGQVLNLRK